MVGPASRRVDPVELDSGRIDPRPFDRIVVGPIFRTPNAELIAVPPTDNAEQHDA